ncbi:MAG TPA: response regulator [Bryobacteraceae bacterium]|nr:response regulator [Bryobacteraceae bacterium]
MKEYGRSRNFQRTASSVLTVCVSLGDKRTFPPRHETYHDAVGQTYKMDPEPVHILLVEDYAGDTLLVQQVLARCPLAYKLHIARDGAQALQMLADPNLKPDLIILDLNLPRITGLGVLERYHSKDTSIVVFSGSSRQTDREFALALGASDYVQKPTDLQAFADVVCEIVVKWAGRKPTGAFVSA